MNRIELNGSWKMKNTADTEWIPATVPGSVLNDLLNDGKINDPFYRENEDDALELADYDYEYERTFVIEKSLMKTNRLALCCDGLDTLCDIYVNGIKVASTDNMHRSYEIDIKEYISVGQNTIRVVFFSPTKYVERKQKETRLWGSTDAVAGYPHLRKGHSMFGWDWGPKIPDAGIWRDIYICARDNTRISDVYITQDHREKAVTLDVKVRHAPFDAECESCSKEEYVLELTVESPAGDVVQRHLASKALENHISVDIEDPAIWWPNGYGGQPLYKVDLRLKENGRVLDTKSYTIGLRTFTIRRQKDEWGESFEYVINGVPIFAKGANYIPEDCLVSRYSVERTARLIEDCVEANFNTIRVWGGGIYPPDYFFDLCDKYGLIVWQDFMFSAEFVMTDDFTANIRKEAEDNIKRLRHHASLGLWCGNNEMEWGWVEWSFLKTATFKADYIKLFEVELANAVAEFDPERFYWPSSPSSGGYFDNPNDSDRGDVHYWDVWHGQKPFTDYRNYFFRFLSEFGFQSFPSAKTVATFTEPEDRNIFSAVMEKHQKNGAANGKILYYLSDTLKYPKDFESLIYASQILQAEAIKYGVEHFRRNPGRCMGAIYWQINDCWPVASWSSIDYFGRWKVLHYFAKRFFAPVLLSACEEGTKVTLAVSNETFNVVKASVEWKFRNHKSEILREGHTETEVNQLSVIDTDHLDCADLLATKDAQRSSYFEYTLAIDGQPVSSSTLLFVKPKHFIFLDPGIKTRVEDAGTSLLIHVSAKNYAKYVELDLKDNDCRFSDNYFDISAGDPLVVEVGKESIKKPLSASEFADDLQIRSCFDIE